MSHITRYLAIACLWGATGQASAEQRPAASAPACVLSSADTMQKVFRDEPWNSPAAARLTIEAARNEVEGIQLVVKSAARKDISVAALEISDLKGEKGRLISKSHVRWHIVGYVKTTKPTYPAPKVGWWPDPLLPGRKFNVKAGGVQPLWINVHVPQDAAGVYQGTVALRLADGRKQSVPLELRVWDFTVPKRQHLETCFLLRPDQLKKFYKLPKVPIEMYERWIDFCLDHRISLTLNDWPNYAKDMERLVARQLGRGGAAFCLAGAWFQKGSPEARRKHNQRMVEQIKGLYDRAKRRGWLDRAYVYCHDEVGKEHYPFARELYGALKKAMPDLRLMQTFYKDDPVTALGDVLDVWAPNIAKYRQAEFRAQQAKGKGVWWYVCCGPPKPYANLMIEWPGIDHRILPWQNWRYGVTGLLYWGTAVCGKNADGPKRWPDVPWDPATFRNKAGNPFNGDGQLIYPGPDGRPLSSIRLENLRDGIEDYEYFRLLRDAVTRLKKAGAARHRGLIAEAAKALAADNAVVKDVTHFTDNAQVLRKARATLALLIERSTVAAAVNTAPAPMDKALAKDWLERWEKKIIGSSRNRYCDREMGEELGWLVSPFLNGFYHGYMATGQRKWIDLLIDWSDAVIKRGAKEPDGYIGWPKVRGASTGSVADFTTDNQLGEAMALRPMVLMAGEMLKNPALKAKYGQKAQAYIKLSERIFEKWDSRGAWREVKGGGLWVVPLFGIDPKTGRWTAGYRKRRTEGFSLPANKQNHIACWLLAMYDVTKKPIYRDRAEKWWRVMKSRMKRRGEGKYFVWNYWDAGGTWDSKPGGGLKHWVGVHPNGGYYGIDVEGIVQAYEHGLVFTRRDIDRLIATNRDFMWNKQVRGAKFQRIDGGRPDKRWAKTPGVLWTALTRYDPMLRKVFEANHAPGSWGGLSRTPQYLARFARTRTTPTRSE